MWSKSACFVVIGLSLASELMVPPLDAKGEKGTMWHVVAENVAGGKKEKFKIRAHEGILYDTVGAKVGVVSPIDNTQNGEKKSKMVWRESLPLLGEFVITQRDKGTWSGTLKTKDGEEWKCLLTD